ncbi:MAG: DNA translocase FtsK 4TM domain-containing protein, partial [Myxococcaceae bacterium]
MDSAKKNYALLPDVLGIALCALGLLLGFSLLSYSSADNALYPHGGYEIQNWIGPGGALIANATYTLFGFLAWVFPVLLAVAGLACFWRKFEWHKTEPVLGSILLFCSVAILLAQLGMGSFAVSFAWGGLLGYGLHAGLVALVSQVGMWLVTLALGLSGAVLLKIRFLKIKIPEKLPMRLPGKVPVFFQESAPVV